MERQFNDQQQARRKKLQDLRDKGINPFGNAYARDNSSLTIAENYGQFSKEELAEKNIRVKIAGRIMSKRRMGKMCFMHIQDRYGSIQLVINKADMGEDCRYW